LKHCGGGTFFKMRLAAVSTQTVWPPGAAPALWQAYFFKKLPAALFMLSHVGRKGTF
jgi:hypothetical protein